MTEHGPDAPRSERGLSAELSRDLRVLKHASERDIRPLVHSMAFVRSRRPDAGHTWRERLMSSIESGRGRTWLASGLAAAAVVIALLVVPISYERTTGHRATLRLSGPIAAGQLASIAAQIKAALRVEHVTLKGEAVDGWPAYTFEASVSRSNHVAVDAVLQAFARGLDARGYRADAKTTPIVKRVSGSVYAFAKDLVIRVESDGKSNAQIEAEIRQRLSEAGVSNAQVSVVDEGNQRKISLSVERTSDGTETSDPGRVTLEMTKNGQSVGGDALSVEQKRMRGPGGVVLQLTVADGGRQAVVEIPNAQTMSDPALAAAVEAKLRQSGFDVVVTASEGTITLSRR